MLFSSSYEQHQQTVTIIFTRYRKRSTPKICSPFKPNLGLQSLQGEAGPGIEIEGGKMTLLVMVVSGSSNHGCIIGA